MKLKLYFDNGCKGENNWGTEIDLESGALQIIEILEFLLNNIRKDINELAKEFKIGEGK